jgi:TP901 family phage tail tape measure protein
MAQRTAIVIDLVINGLQNIEKLGQLILAAVSSPKIRAGFQVLQQAMLGVSAGAAKATDTFKRFMIAIAAISQNPAFITFAKKVAVLLKIISNELNKTNQGVKSNADYWKKLSMALGIVSILFRSLAHLVKDVGLGLMRVSQSTFGFFKSIGSAGGDIQAKLSELQGLLGMVTQTGPQFQSLANEIVRVGKESSQTISQVAGLANELARAGFGAEDIQKSIASVVQLSEAAGLSAEQAATIAANVKTMFNLQASELSRVNDVLTTTANASTTSVQSLGESFTYVGPLASSFGFSVEEISAALGVLANAGQKGSVAGAGLQQMFSQLIAHSDKVDAALAAHGKSFQDVNPEIHSVVEIMQVFQDVNLDTAQIIEIFSERARKTFLALQSQGVDTLKAFEKLNKESRGIAESVAKVRMDNLPGDVLRLKSAFEALQFTVFQVMQDRLRELVQWVTHLINSVSAWVEKNKDLIALLTDMGIELGIVVGALGALIFALGSANIVLSTFLTAGASALGAVTLLGTYTKDLGTYLKTKFVASLNSAKAAVLTFTASCYSAVTSLFTFQGAALALDKTLKKIAATWTSVVAVLTAPVTIGLTAAIAVLTSVFYGFFHNWSKIKDAFVESFSGMAGGFMDGFKSGFGDVYETFLGPMLEQFGDVVVYLIEQVALLFGGGSGSAWENIGYITGTLLAGLLSIIQMITNGIVALIAIVVKVVNVFLSLITLDFSPITDFIGWLFGIKSSADQASSSVRYLGKTLAEWKTQMAGAIDVSNGLVKSTLDVLNSVDEMGSKLEKGGSMVSRIFQLQPNELNELIKTIDEVANAGGELSSRGVQEQEGKLDAQLTKLRDQRAKLEAEYSESTLKGISRTGPDGEKEVAGIKQAKAQLDKLISDVEKSKSKLQDIGKNFELIDIVIGSGGYEKFKNQLKYTEDAVEGYTKSVARNKAEVERIESSAVGGSEFATEDIKQKKLKEAQAVLEFTIAEREKYLKKFGLLSQAANKEIFDQIFDLSGVPIADRAKELAKRLLELQEKTEDTAKATENWKKRLEEIEKMYEKIDEFLLNARAKLASAGLDPQSKEEFEFNFNTERAREELNAMIHDMQMARDEANMMGDIGTAMTADAKAQELIDIQVEMEAQAKLDLAKIQEKNDKDRQESLLDMELELAKVRKDKAKEIALTQQKFDAETAKLREQFLIRDAAGNVIGERDGRADFERLRNEKLAVALKNVNDSYADKAPIDRTKEMADIQNESYQILLKKVQSTKDLFMLERALLKIQEMQQAAALKASRRAIQSESLAEKIRQKRDQAAAMGMDTSKLDLDLKRATERAGIMRGFSDLKNKQSGIGTSDVNALTAATAAMDATSKAVMDKIGAKMLVISGALVGMSVKFAESAELWIDSFVSAWENSSDKIENTVLGTFERIKLSLETGGLNIPNPEATLPAVTGTPAVSAAGASVINNNFQVTATDPMEAGKKMARLIDQSTRDM